MPDEASKARAEALMFNTLTETRYGTMLVNRHDAYVGRSLLELGEFSAGEVALLRGFVNHGDVVLDIGANCGALTIPLAHMVGDEGRVIAFEPQHGAHLLLCANVALASLLNVDVHRVAVGQSPGTAHIPRLDPRQPANIGGLSLSAQGEPVPLVSIDALQLQRCDLMKIDVEGYELPVMHGAVQTITTHRPILIVEADREPQRAPMFSWLVRHGYRIAEHTPPLYNADNYCATRENPFGDVVSINWLCLPDARAWPVVDHLTPLVEEA